ncbi:CD225/dispanin family protein [Lysobacter yangpyeongensis]|uniref:CD225/dispanin family protein n=1 Tax=Lysobacter yangpyeongensis TaxID=346182 RepID=A0ABW0SPT8_9GAMM
MSSTPPSFPPEQAQAYGPLPNYLIWAILITIASLCLCCIVGTIPGVVAIVFASQVNSKLSAGDRAGAEHASKQAKLWCQITTGLCVLGLLINIGLRIAGYDSTQYWKQWAEQMEQRR